MIDWLARLVEPLNAVLFTIGSDQVSTAELLGFITGGLCVALTVRRSILNFPVGIANCVFFLVLFVSAQLWAGATLQLLYIGLGAIGWWQWRSGRTGDAPVTVRRSHWRVLTMCVAFVAVGTWALSEILTAVDGSAPLWDALTTCLALAAQWLLNTRRIETWFFWIAADCIYIPLYISQGLNLTAAIYVLFLGLCILGLREWTRARVPLAESVGVMNEFRHGLLVGKFYPPHLGHHQAIRAAAARCDAFTVLVMASAVETVPLADRVAWMREEHAGDANVRVAGIRCDAPMDVTDQRVWAAQVAVMRAGIGGVAVDAVFSGDDYCVELARWFDAKAVRLERAGSSTSVRRDLAGRWDQLATPTRAGLTTRVVVLGAESTGTTTIARRLAAHYAARGGVWSATQCVEEYGRDYTALKWAGNPGVRLDEMVWTAEDFDLIGPEQTRREQAAARAGSPVLICDTDAFATAIWKRRYLGDPSGGAWTAVPPRAVYLVTDHVGVPWDDDGMREGDLAVRAAMTGWFIDALTGAGHSWVLLTGTPEQRLDVAFRTVEPLLQLRARFGEPLRGPGFEATE